MTFRIGRVGVPVVAEFTCPEPRTIVMRIVDGEGAAASSKLTPPHWVRARTGGREPR